MKKKDIEKSIKRAVNQAPSLDLEKLASTNVIKMTEHDYITRQEAEQKPRHFKQISAAFAFGIMMLVCISGWFVQFKMPDSVIALDVNPSIEIVTNKQNKILSIKAVNEDARKVIGEHDYVNSDLNSTVESICKSMINQGYLNNNKNVIMVSVENGDTDKAATQAKLLSQVIHNNVSSNNITPHILRQVLNKDEDKKKSALAEKYNVSIGKINLITEIAASDEKLTVEQLSDMSIKDILTTCQDKDIDLHEIIQTDDKDLHIPGNTDSNSNNGASTGTSESSSTIENSSSFPSDSTSSGQGSINNQDKGGNDGSINDTSTSNDEGSVNIPDYGSSNEDSGTNENGTSQTGAAPDNGDTGSGTTTGDTTGGSDTQAAPGNNGVNTPGGDSSGASDSGSDNSTNSTVNNSQ